MCAAVIIVQQTRKLFGQLVRHQKWINHCSLSTANTSSSDFNAIDQVTYEKVCSETLNGLCDYFEEIIENQPQLKTADVSYGDGVLTVNFGQPHGTYVINRQSPNKQIWLSSPTTGPKRYDFLTVGHSGKWIYRHNNESLHDLLQREIKEIITDNELDFHQLPFSK